MEIFTGMLVHDGFSVLIRGVLLGFLVLFLLLTKLTRVPSREDAPDIHTLFLGATLGFCLMASANHLMMVFLAVEMASIPSYVLAGMLRRHVQGSEAALKYAVFGAGAAGIMLYGISLVAGLVNAVHLPTVAERLAVQLPGMNVEQLLVLSFGCLLIVSGLAFKLSAVPAHFWCPDVFEGSCAEVGGFLSVASKAAALALSVRVAIGLGAIPPTGVEPGSLTAARAAAAQTVPRDALSAAHRDADATQAIAYLAPPAGSAVAATPGDDTTSAGGLKRIQYYLGRLFALLAIITCTFGNLAAYAQTNIKRLLAYSTIAHAGYMLMALPPLLALAGVDARAAQNAASALAIYIVVYLFMNLGAFAIVAFMRDAIHSEQIADYAGLLRRCPLVAICFSVILLSLVGIPPLSGFFGKFAVFAALTESFKFTGDPYLIVLLAVGGVNSVISLFFYLRVVRVMTMVSEGESPVPCSIPLMSLRGAYICLLTIPTAALFFLWDRLGAWAVAATQFLLT